MAAIKSLTVMTAVLACPAVGSMDLASVVNTIEHRNTVNSDLISEIRSFSEVKHEAFEATPLRAELFAELRGAREQEQPKISGVRKDIFAELRNAREAAQPQPSALRMDILSELRAAREQVQPKPSAVRQELMAELRAAREQETPKPSAVRMDILSELRAAREEVAPKPSAVRQDIFSELRAAREEMQPQAPSAARQSLFAELQAARQQEEAVAQPSAVRNELMAELKASRAKSDLDKFLDELEEEEPASADELPWDDREEIMDVLNVIQATPAEAASTADNMDALNRLVRTLLVSGVAFGLAAAAKLPELDMSSKRMSTGPSQWITLALFYAPLALVTADYTFNMAVGNEFGLIAACWGLAAVAAAHLRSKEEQGKIFAM